MGKQEFYAVICSIIAVIGGLIFGLDIGIMSGCIKFIKADLGLNDLQIGSVASAPSLGAIIAYLFVGSAVAKLGRKKILILIAFGYLLSAVMSTLSVGYYSLIVGRFIGGAAFMSIAITSMYVGEIAPSRFRGKIIAANQVNIGIGVFIAYIINYVIILARPADPVVASHSYLFSNEHIWRYMLGVITIPCFIWFVLLFFIQESPRWLLLKEREEEARTIVAKITSSDNVETIMTEIKNNLAELPKVNIIWEAKTLFSSPMRKILILGVGLAISQSAAAVGIVSSYAPILFEQVGLGAKSALFQTALLGAIATVASIIAMFVVDRFGRRPVYILGAFLILVCHLTLWYSFKTVSYEITPTAIEQVQKAHPTFNVEPLQEKIGTTFKSDLTFKSFLSKNYDAKFLTLNDNVFIKAFVTFSVSPSVIVFIIFLFKFAFFFSVGPLMWVVLSEIVPLYMRSFAIPFFGLVCGIVSWTTPKYFLWQLDVMGTANTFLFYGILAIAALIFIVVYLPETKNKTIEEVGEMLIKN